MPKRDYDYTLKEVIEQLLRAYQWDERLDEARLKDSWEKIVGGIVGKHTTGMAIKKKILYVSLDSSALRNELMMSRSKIVKMLNEEAGKQVIEDIVFR